MNLLLELSVIIIVLSLGISTIKLLKASNTSERVVALDAMAIMSVSILIILSIYYDRSFYLDIALVFGIIGFLGVVIFGRYIEKGL